MGILPPVGEERVRAKAPYPLPNGCHLCLNHQEAGGEVLIVTVTLRHYKGYAIQAEVNRGPAKRGPDALNIKSADYLSEVEDLHFPGCSRVADIGHDYILGLRHSLD